MGEPKEKALFDVLVSVYYTLQDPARWTKNCDAEDSLNRMVAPDSEEAVKWSLGGALMKARKEHVHNDVIDAAGRLARALIGTKWGNSIGAGYKGEDIKNLVGPRAFNVLETYNNHKLTLHRHVMSVIAGEIRAAETGNKIRVWNPEGR